MDTCEFSKLEWTDRYCHAASEETQTEGIKMGRMIISKRDLARDISVTMIPLDDRVIVKPQEVQNKTPGGILLPDAAKKRPVRGTVIATGPGRIDRGERMDMQVKPGDTVVYSQYSGTEVEDGSDTLLILSESEILAKIK